MKSFQKLKESSKAAVKYNVYLNRYSSFGIGGKAVLLIEPSNILQVKKILSCIKKEKIKYVILGGGTNVLFPSQGFDGAVIRLSSEQFRKIRIKKNLVIAGAGAMLSKVILASIKNSLTGLEKLCGIPGTIGGAVIMNAGRGVEIGDFIHKVKILDKNGRIRWVKKKDILFRYRNSKIGGLIVLEVILKLATGKKNELVEFCNDAVKQIKRSQPWGKKSAGCVFKNPVREKCTAGELIESVNLKGYSCGGAQISRKHANFIINKGNATSHDVLSVMNYAREQVKQKHNVRLKPEIIVI